MNILILCPGKTPKSTDEISCFSEVVNFYLPKAFAEFASTTVKEIPNSDCDDLRKIFESMEVSEYDVILTLGLRFYSKISSETTQILRDRFGGLLCQVHDGSRLDHDPVDITFTFKDDTERMSKDPRLLIRHTMANSYMGWAADPELNVPRQSSNIFRILIDHTNYGDNPVDWTDKVLSQVKTFIESEIWTDRYKSVSVRRFDSGRVVDVSMTDLSYHRYDRSLTMPLSEISREHSEAHVFCVTHPESVGLVVLETAMAGAMVVSPKGFIPADRLSTVRHIEWDTAIDWKLVLESIDIDKSRTMAMENTWYKMAQNIVRELNSRLGIKNQ